MSTAVFRCLCAAFAAAVVSATSLAAKPDSSEIKYPGHMPPRPPPLQLTDFWYSAQDENGVLNTVEADNLVIRPRRYLVFNIKSLNEAILTRAHLQVHLRDKDNADVNPFDVKYEDIIPFTDSGAGSENRSRGSGFGIVTRLLAEDLTLDVLRKASTTLVLTAERGLVENRKGEAQFINATLSDPRTGRLIRSNRILWDNKRKKFMVPGTYSLTAPRDQVRGEAISVDLDFNIKPAPS
jgi:hypothetical protein